MSDFDSLAAATQAARTVRPTGVERSFGQDEVIVTKTDLKDRRELFAYVVNLAGDGAHYWVLAHVTPSIGPNGEVLGYHSNRRLPDPRAIREIEPIYRTLAAEERRHGRAVDAARVGADLLHQMLAERNTDYDRFVWSLTNGVAA